MRNATSRTALACNLLSIFYPKKDLQGKRLQELDQDVIEAITGKIYPLLLHEYGMYSFFSQCENRVSIRESGYNKNIIHLKKNNFS